MKNVRSLKGRTEPMTLVDGEKYVVTRIAAQRRDPERVNIFVNGEFCCGAAHEVVLRERIRNGEVLEADRIQRLIASDTRWKARESALTLLGARARSRGELADRLRRKGYDESAVDFALKEVDRLGLIDDRAFAESWARDRIRLRPRGARALTAELSRKRIPADIARAAIDSAMQTEGADEHTLCMQCAQKWARARSATPIHADDRTVLQRRLAAFLARRGYDPAHIRDAVRAALMMLP